MMKTKGFTLIELMVSIVLYGIIMVSVLASFWNLVTIRERADHFRNLERELNFAMTRVTDNIRGFSVKYPSTTGGGAGIISGDQTDIEIPKPISNSSGIISDTTRIEFNTDTRIKAQDLLLDESLIDGLEKSNVLIGTTVPGSGVPLLSRKVQLSSVVNQNIFKIYPEADPYESITLYEQDQPRVEIYMSLEDVRFPELKLSVKTTVSSRRYSKND